MKHFISISLILILIFSCGEKEFIDILITDAEVIDVESGAILSQHAIGIKDGKIKFITDGSTAGYQAEQVIAAEGNYIIPGLWDMHIHFRGGEELIEDNKRLIPLFVANGITGVREAGGDMTSSIFQWQDEIETGELIGPEIFTSGPKLDGLNATWAGSIPVTTQKEAVQAVDSLESMGVDFIKLYDSRISREAYLWILEEAEKRGIRTSGHMPFTVMLENAVETGLGSVEHLYYVLKGTSTQEKEVTEAVRAGEAGFWGSMTRLMETSTPEKQLETYIMLRENDTYVTPTLYIGNTLSYLKETDHESDEYQNYISDEIIGTYSGRIRSALRASDSYTQMRQNLNSTFISMVAPMQEAGVQLLAGSDCGASNSYVYPGISLHQELAAMVDAGLPEIEALKAATINGAEFLKVEEEYGSLKAGKAGDLLILSDNPLENIENTQKIEAMILKGKVFSSAEMKSMLDSMKK